MKKEITLQPITDDIHRRYTEATGKIKKLKISKYKVIPFFLVEMLEADERSGFKKIKELWKKNAAMIF